MLVFNVVLFVVIVFFVVVATNVFVIVVIIVVVIVVVITVVISRERCAMIGTDKHTDIVTYRLNRPIGQETLSPKGWLT